MSDTDRYDWTQEYASPPCFMHKLGMHEAEAGSRVTNRDRDGWSDVVRWRTAERKRLLDARMALDPQARMRRSARVAAALDRTIGNVGGRVVASYWPFRGELDLRSWASRIVERGGRIVLPVVVRKGWPLEFRVWRPGEPLERGLWNIPVPSRGPALQPDVVIAPLVGFDEAKYRLGYGGGYFDRTLAAMAKRAFVVGVGLASSRVPTIYPQPHDIPMDTIVTD